MMARSFRLQIVILCFFLCALLETSGCDKLIRPVKVIGASNMFGLTEENWGGTVDSVVVWTQTGEREYRDCWKIRAKRNIPVAHFRVTVGSVPEGFEQIIPPVPEVFVPIPGKEYNIAIECQFKPPAFIGETPWIAD